MRNYFKEGFEEGANDYFYATDHLGSVREVVASDGTTIASRRLYDPWGKATESGSAALSDFGFTGHYLRVSTARSSIFSGTSSGDDGRVPGQLPVLGKQ